MKKITEIALQGIFTGATAALILFLLVMLFAKGEKTDPYNLVKAHYKVTDARFSKPSPNPREEGFITTVTFKSENERRKKISSVFVDLEFFDSEGTFLFDFDHGDPWGSVLLPPKEEDNVAVQVYIPTTIDIEKISKVTADVYELVQK